jgi:hypothetical protein
MGIKESIKSIITRLQTIQCTNQDGNVVPLNVMLWANQLDDQADMMVYAKPACFLEIIFSDGLPIGANALSYEVTFRVMVEQEQYNSEGDIDLELSLLDLKDSVHRKLQGFKPLNCSHLYQSVKTLDYTQSNRYLFVLEYTSHFVDLVGSIHDTNTGTYIEQTIENPILQIEENMYVGTLPDDGSGVTPTIVNGSIIAGSGFGPTIWYSGDGIPSATLGKNSDFYLNNLNGDVYKKVSGVWVYQMTIQGVGSIATSQVFTSTSGQSVYTITGGYIVGAVDVYFNGIKLIKTEYTATNGTSVTINVAAQLNDIVEILKYE